MKNVPFEFSSIPGMLPQAITSTLATPIATSETGFDHCILTFCF
jgi:hypothetical protein